jgi:pimeloyl-ACP methyl ester carboxylesterase
MEALVAGLLQQLEGPGYHDAMMAIYPGFFHPDADRELVAACAADAAATAPEVATGYLRALATMEPTAGAALPMPVLFVWAEQALRPATAEDLRRLVPHSQFVQVPASGHFVHLEAPEAFNREVERFVDSLGS